ncbi:hypothetical protein GBA52_013671 [Prunus armeniaca]|nr:hypothetical protein GBA52_013671 [Prunus armeniaca]
MEEHERVVQQFNERLTLSLELTFRGNLIFSEGLNLVKIGSWRRRWKLWKWVFGEGRDRALKKKKAAGGQRRDERGEMTKEDTFWGRV